MRFSQASWTANGKYDERNLGCFIHSKHPYLLNQIKIELMNHSITEQTLKISLYTSYFIIINENVW